jgi:hypothetical protein
MAGVVLLIVKMQHSSAPAAAAAADPVPPKQSAQTVVVSTAVAELLLYMRRLVNGELPSSSERQNLINGLYIRMEDIWQRVQYCACRLRDLKRGVLPYGSGGMSSLRTVQECSKFSKILTGITWTSNVSTTASCLLELYVSFLSALLTEKTTDECLKIIANIEEMEKRYSILERSLIADLLKSF